MRPCSSATRKSALPLELDDSVSIVDRAEVRGTVPAQLFYNLLVGLALGLGSGLWRRPARDPQRYDQTREDVRSQARSGLPRRSSTA